MNLNQYHTIARTVVLVDIPAAMFLIACAWIGWPIAITMHWLFFWFGFIAFATILAIGIAKLESKTLIPIGRDRELFKIEVEQQRQKLLPPSPDIEDDQNMVSTHRLVAPSVQLSGLDMSTQMSSTVQPKDGSSLHADEIEAPVYNPMEEAIYHNEKNKLQRKPHYTDEQLGGRFGVSAKTIQRTRNDMKGKGKLS